MNKFILYAIACIILSNTLYAKTKFAHGNPCATHQHVLYEMAVTTNGPIIEFGCGDTSTPMLHAICKKISDS
jgi:hypothetical protein